MLEKEGKSKEVKMGGKKQGVKVKGMKWVTGVLGA
jgi:hypothetical protein